MMHIPTYVGPSHIHGLGVYTSTSLKKDTLLWSFADNFDRRYTADEFYNLHPSIHEFYKIYGYQDIHDGLYYMTIDNDRFTNHSDTPNTYFDGSGNVFALKNIRKNQEVTSNYKDFMCAWDTHVTVTVKENTDAKIAA